MSKRSDERKRSPYSNKKVLIVDDSKVTTLAIKNFLGKQDIEDIEVVENIEELEDYLESGDRPDLVTMDMVLPDGDGEEACEMIWERFRNVPIVFITADEVDEEVQENLSKVKLFKEKPVTQELIDEILEEVF